MKTNSKSTKFTNLENLLSEILYKDTEAVLLETLKSFLKFKLDLEEIEANNFISQLKKLYPNSHQYTLEQILSSIKTNSLNIQNPFEDNILSDISHKKPSNDFDKSNTMYYIEIKYLNGFSK